MKLTPARLAWRNLWRHPQRTFLMIIMVAFGSFVIILFWGVTDGWITSMTHANVVLDQGDFKVFAAGYRGDPSPTNGLTATQLSKVMSTVTKLRNAHSTPRLVTYGMVKSAYGSIGMEIRGIDPTLEPKVTTLYNHVVNGRFLHGAGGILLSTYTASQLNVRVGERVVVLAQGENGPSSRAFTVVGFFSSGLIGLDRSTVFISLSDARKLTGWEGATEVAVSLTHGNPKQVATALSKRLGNRFAVATYFDLNPIVRDMIQISIIEMTPMILILALLVGFGVANTVIYSVIERTREFGVMAALGMSSRQLSQMVLTESILTSLIGFLLGGGLGYAVNLYLAHHGWSFGSTFGDMAGNIGMPTVIYAATSGWYWLGSFSVVVITGLVAAWYPARRAARLEPVEAIREE